MQIPEEVLNDFDFEDIYNKNWELRPGKEYVIRGTRRGRPMDVVEKSFTSARHADRYMHTLFRGNYEVTMATNHAVFLMKDVGIYDLLSFWED